MRVYRGWSTSDVKTAERVAYWTEAICGTFVQLECNVLKNRREFFGDIQAYQLGMLGLSRIRATAQSVSRTLPKIRQSSEDCFLVNIQIAGHGLLMQDGKVADLRPGDFALYDSNRPYQMQFEDRFEQLVLTLPGPVLRSRLRDVQNLTAYRVDGRKGAVAPLLPSMVRQLMRAAPALEPVCVSAVAESVVNMLLAGLTEQPGVGVTAVSDLASLRRDQIRAYVIEHLREPGLSAESIAAFLRVTPSTVYRAWAGESDSLNAWIWSKRLDGVCRDLCDPALTKKTITDIAYDWGFNDSAHFSRAFRVRFGCSAREFRAQASRPRRLT